MPKTAIPLAAANLGVKAYGLEFANPVGLAAGFDKDCQIASQAFSLGFGFAEIGTVVPKPQLGRGATLRRFYRRRAIYNRLGFPSKGVRHFAAALAKAKEHRGDNGGVLGANIGCNHCSENRLRDYRIAAAELTAADYLTINVSSPNTEGLRGLQQPSALMTIAELVRGEFSGPLFVKLAPDGFVDDHRSVTKTAEAVLKSEFSGVVLTNTSSGLVRDFMGAATRGGGISGLPLKRLSIAAVRRFADVIKGEKLIIGCGGISSGEDALDYIKAGAHLLQLYSAMVFEGLFVARKIVARLQALCEGNTLDELNPYPLRAKRA